MAKPPKPLATPAQPKGTVPRPLLVLPVINRKPLPSQDPIPHVPIASNSISAVVNNYYNPKT